MPQPTRTMYLPRTYVLAIKAAASRLSQAGGQALPPTKLLAAIVSAAFRSTPSIADLDPSRPLVALPPLGPTQPAAHQPEGK